MTASLPSESQLLSSFLLPPTPLALYLSLSDFRALFPSKHRNDPTVELLYRELQHQVAVGADEVKRNIAAEAERGQKVMGRVRRMRAKREQQVGMEGNDDLLMVGGIEEEGGGGWMDVVLENELKQQTLPNHSAPTPTAPHTPSTLIPAMKNAISDLQAEIAALQDETQSILQEITTTVGDLSDLRYGKFPNQGGSDVGMGGTEANSVAEEVIREIKRVESVCLQGQGASDET